MLPTVGLLVDILNRLKSGIFVDEIRLGLG